MYSYRYINKQIEKNGVFYTLLIRNESSRKDFRFEVAFKKSIKEIDDEFLRLEADKQIQLLTLLENVDNLEEESLEEQQGEL
jgi:hypothetical protein